MEISFAPPEITVARPGDLSNFSSRYRLRFEDGSVSLIHREAGPKEGTVADTREVNGHPADIDAIIPDRERWKHPGIAYLAAWDEGGRRLWIRKGDHGIQCLVIHNDAFHDGGHWSMRSRYDHLAHMPKGVRTALDLSGRFYMISPYSSPQAEARQRLDQARLSPARAIGEEAKTASGK